MNPVWTRQTVKDQRELLHVMLVVVVVLKVMLLQLQECASNVRFFEKTAFVDYQNRIDVFTEIYWLCIVCQPC